MSSTLTVYPDASPESTSVDGCVRRSPYNGETWANIRADGLEVYTTDNTSGVAKAAHISNSWNTNKWDSLARFFMLFDASALPTGATVTGATIDLWAYGITQSLAGQSLVIVSSNPASNTALADGDYDTIGSTAFSNTIAVSSLADEQYNTFTLNASGLAAIVDGVCKFACVLDCDRSNTEPSYGSYNKTAGCGFYCAEQTSPDKRPKLTITYDTSSPQTLSPDAVTGSGTIPATTVNRTLSQASTTGTATVPLPTLIAIGPPATLTPAPTAGAGTIPAATVTQAQTPAAVTGAATVPAATVTTAATLSPAAVVGTGTIPAWTLTSPVTLSPASVEATAYVPSLPLSYLQTLSPAAIPVAATALQANIINRKGKNTITPMMHVNTATMAMTHANTVGTSGMMHVNTVTVTISGDTV